MTQNAVHTPSTPVADIAPIVANLRNVYKTRRTHELHWRIEQLRGIERFLAERESEIHAALRADLGKPLQEAFEVELGLTADEARLMRKKLPSWIKPDKVGTPLAMMPASAHVHHDPLGLVLIIGPWNYPVQLLISPLIGAIAGGNCAIVKPSEMAANTSAMLAELLPKYVDRECIKVVEGGVPETTALLEQRFDHILYTGNAAVGRIVMAAAVKHLTPVTLELGGKSPTIVDERVNLDVAAHRIIWGKCLNAGQTCLAPDYVLAHETIYEPLLEQMKAVIQEFFGDNPQESPDFARIINERHFDRLMKLINSGKIVVGGENDRDSCYIAPTILTDVAEDAPVMQEEIFGPILPVIKVPNIDAAIDHVNAREKPLGLYIFSTDSTVQRKVLRMTTSGGVTINHIALHCAAMTLPFGGVGESGMGAYHGRTSFETFTHQRAVLNRSMMKEPPLVYPPYSAKKLKWLRRIL